MRRVMILAMALFLPAAILAQERLFDPVTGYRLTHYRSVVAAAPEGVTRIDTAQAHALWRRGAIFIDVNPAPGAVRETESSRWALAEPHASIPGAHWLAETGRGALTAKVEHWFPHRVHALAAKRPDRPIVVFCQTDCWMSWNAALRLNRAGIRNIIWFADGLDGWREAQLPLAVATPDPSMPVD